MGRDESHFFSRSSNAGVLLLAWLLHCTVGGLGPSCGSSSIFLTHLRFPCLRPARDMGWDGWDGWIDGGSQVTDCGTMEEATTLWRGTYDAARPSVHFACQAMGRGAVGRGQGL